MEMIVSWFLNLQRPDYFAISSALVAFASFTVSFLNFRRDRGTLDVKVGIWQAISVSTGEKNGDFIRITAVNSGRRPIVADSVGGFPRWQKIMKILNRFFPDYFKPIGFFITDPAVTQELFDRNTGKYRVLMEGESIQIAIPLVETTIQDHWFKVHDFYVGDTTGREHKVPRRVVRKFLNDLKKHVGKHATQ